MMSWGVGMTTTLRHQAAEKMNSFAFIIHPIDAQRDVARKFPLLGKLPPGVIDYFSRFFPPVYLSHIVGIRSTGTGQEIEGWLIACPMTPKRMLDVQTATAYGKIIEAGRLAERLGAGILGLGAFTSVVGDAGVTVSQRLSIPVTTGKSYTVAVAVEASLAAARRMDLDPARCIVAVVGAYGSIGRACAGLLARAVPNLILVGRQMARLREVQRQVEAMGARAICSTDMASLRQADLVLAVTSSSEPIIQPEDLKTGSVVCDVARPRNVHQQVSERRDDVLVIDGGVVSVPGAVDFGFDFGLPAGMAYACMAETMILALDGRYESFTLGKHISLERVEEIAQLAAKHGFRLSSLRSFERALTDQEVERIRRNAHQARLWQMPACPESEHLEGVLAHAR
jgi:fatty aldehyde-generating acyl-ACP reductase